MAVVFTAGVVDGDSNVLLKKSSVFVMGIAMGKTYGDHRDCSSCLAGKICDSTRGSIGDFEQHLYTKST